MPIGAPGVEVAVGVECVTGWLAHGEVANGLCAGHAAAVRPAARDFKVARPIGFAGDDLTAEAAGLSGRAAARPANAQVAELVCIAADVEVAVGAVPARQVTDLPALRAIRVIATERSAIFGVA